MMNIKGIWHSFSPNERRNIIIYVGGIMLHRLGSELFIGSISTLATDRFKASSAFSKLGAAKSLQHAAHCIGAILIAPLVKRWPTRLVLPCTTLFSCLMTTILLIVDAATGGKMKPAGTRSSVYGHWDPDLIFVIWTLSGVATGMTVILRRVIPVDIVGGDGGKLRRMDAIVQILNELVATGAAFASSSAISRWGNNYAFFLSPVFNALAAGVWLCMDTTNSQGNVTDNTGADDHPRKNKYLSRIARGAWGFVESIWVGSKIVMTNRDFIWLIPSYSLALYLHRFLDGTLALAYAKRVLGVSEWAEIIRGGAFLGEVFGALSVLIFSDIVTTPLPWLRIDALTLNLVWLLPYFAIRATQDVSWAWKIFGLFTPIAFGWAAGDVSLVAYIQAVLSRSNIAHRNISPLGAVMAFLYCAYVVLSAVLGAALGKVIDNDFTKNKDVTHSFIQVGSIQFSVCCGIILLSTFLPAGAFAFNPKAIGGAEPRETDQSEGTVEVVEVDLEKKGDEQK